MSSTMVQINHLAIPYGYALIRLRHLLFLTSSHLQAFKEHKIVDIFYSPGECDITANVDFALLKESMADLGMFDDDAFLCNIINKAIQSRRMGQSPNATSSRAWAYIFVPMLSRVRLPHQRGNRQLKMAQIGSLILLGWVNSTKCSELLRKVAERAKMLLMSGHSLLSQASEIVQYYPSGWNKLPISRCMQNCTVWRYLFSVH